MNSSKIEKLLVSLDTILDTRIGTIKLIDEDKIVPILSNKYHSREIDDFDGISRDEFLKKYQERNEETLAASTVTNIFKLLREIVNNLNEQATVRPYLDGVIVSVNIYPYQIDDETRDAIRQAVSVHLKNTVVVEIVNIPYKDLTPSFCKANYAMMVMYDYEEWLNLQAEAFKQVRIPEITLFAPAIYFNKVPTKDELEESIKSGAHPMMAIEMLASPLVELKLLDVMYFSILN